MKKLTLGVLTGILLVPALGSDLAQALTAGGTPQAVGVVDTNGSVFIRATVSDAPAGLNCRLELEVRPVGTPFSNVATHMSGMVASGTLVEIALVIAPSSPVQPFHWQARSVNQAFAATAWAAFGGNAETEADFTCDFRPAQPANLMQHHIPSASASSPDAVGVTDTNAAMEFISTTTDPDGENYTLQIEIQPLGTGFTGTPTLSSAGSTASGSPAFALESDSPINTEGGYHWQARTLNALGYTSDWASFGGNAETAADFREDAVNPGFLKQYVMNPGFGASAVGAVDTNAEMIFGAVATDPEGVNFTLQIEIQPVGTGFTNVPLGPNAFGFSGNEAQIFINASINTEGDYHWQVRIISSFNYTSDWVSFGLNAETAADFREDTVNPGFLKQYVMNPGFGASAVGAVDTNAEMIFGAVATDPEGVNFTLQIEIQPVGTGFTNVPLGPNAFGFSGNEAQIFINASINTEGDYHWQVRIISSFNYTSDWVSFGLNAETAADFREDAVDPGFLQQALTPGGASAPAGSIDPDGVVELRATATDPEGVNYTLDVEVQPIGTGFTGTPTGPGAFGSSGNQAVISFTASGSTAYHWQARITNSFGYLSNWVAFGANPETTPDFIVGGTPPVPSALAQSMTSLGGSLAAGAMFDADGTVFLRATVLTASGFGTAQLQLEVQLIGSPLTGTPNYSSGFVASGAVAEVSITLGPGIYHWAARVSDTVGTSAFVSFGGNLESGTDFTVDTAEPDSVVITSGPIGPGYGGTIVGTAADATSGLLAVEIRLQQTSSGQFWNGTAFQAAPVFVAATITGGTWSYPFGALEGESYVVTSRATDLAGNVETTLGSATFLFDSIAPASTPTTSGAQTAATYTSLQGTAADASSGVIGVMITIRWVNTNQFWNGTTFVAGATFLPAGGTTSWSYAFAPQGGQTYEIQSRATDAAGNVQSLLGLSQFTYDATGPDSTVQTSGAYTPATWPGAIAGTATTGAGATITLVEVEVQRASDGMYWNGAAFQAAPIFIPATGTTSWSLPFAVTVDTFTILSRATDDTAAVESALGSATILVSTDLPTSTITTAGVLTIGAWPGAVAGTASGGSGGIVLVELEIQRDSDGLYWNGTAWQAAPIFLPATGTVAWSLAFTPDEGQTYTLRARATDAAAVVQSPETGAFLAIVSGGLGTSGDSRNHVQCKISAGASPSSLIGFAFAALLLLRRRPR